MSKSLPRGAESGADVSLMRYIWSHTKRQQIWILLVVLLSLPTYFIALELPKLIINGPIQGAGYASPEATQRLLDISIPAPAWLSPSGRLTLLPGFELTRTEMLLSLSGLFLLLVIINGLFKLYINTFKGKLGERMLRRLRYDLVDRVLRFPLARFKRVKSPEVATMIKDEVEPLGPFIGDAFVQPLYLGGQAATAMAFILVQDLSLGLIAAGIVALQALVIPKLRRRLIVLGRERQLTARELAGRVGEIVEGIATIRLNDVSHYERADIGARLGRIYSIRFDIYQWKFLVKFLNNFLAQVTPFLFYLVGGYLVIRGRLDLGQLVAVIAAYRDLPPPIKELIDWDQQRIDAQVKYAQVIQQFAPEDLIDASLQAPAPQPVARLDGAIAVSNLAVVDEAGTKLIERASVTLPLNERVAVVGRAAGEGEALVDAVARLIVPSGGRIAIDSANLQTIPEARLGRRVAYAGPDGFLPQATLRDTLLYVLKHAPVRAAAYDAAAQKARAKELAEARRAANSTFDVRADWIDYDAAGATDRAELVRQLCAATRVAGLYEDIIDFGLGCFVDPEHEPERAARVVEARKALRQTLASSELAGLVALFDSENYNPHATVAENLLFGTAVGPAFSDANLAGNDYIQQVLSDSGLDARLFEMGSEIGATAIEMFAGLPPDHPFFAQLSFMDAEQIPAYAALLQSIRGKQMQEVSPDDRRSISRLTFAYVEPRHRMGLLDGPLMQRILAARRLFRERLPARYAGAIEFYDPERYNRAASLQDNILFGRIAHGIAEGPQRVLGAIRRLLRELDLEQLVFDAGLDFNVGHGGTRLAAAQRQKLGVARALLKRPDYALFKHPLPALNAAAQEEIMRAVLERSRDPAAPFGVLWALPTPQPAFLFDKVAVFERGVLTEFGPPAELRAAGGGFARLLD